MAKRKKAESKLNTTCSQLIELCLSKGPFKSTSLAKWHILTPPPLSPSYHTLPFFLQSLAPLFYSLKIKLWHETEDFLCRRLLEPITFY